MSNIVTRKSSAFDGNLCIICQKRKNIETNETGRKKIRISAAGRNDEVSHRLSILKENDIFYYHMNKKCFTSYVETNNVESPELGYISNAQDKGYKNFVECESSEKLGN